MKEKYRLLVRVELTKKSISLSIYLDLVRRQVRQAKQVAISVEYVMKLMPLVRY